MIRLLIFCLWVHQKADYYGWAWPNQRNSLKEDKMSCVMSEGFMISVKMQNAWYLQLTSNDFILIPMWLWERFWASWGCSQLATWLQQQDSFSSVDRWFVLRFKVTCSVQQRTSTVALFSLLWYIVLALTPPSVFSVIIYNWSWPKSSDEWPKPTGIRTLNCEVLQGRPGNEK